MNDDPRDPAAAAFWPVIEDLLGLLCHHCPRARWVRVREDAIRLIEARLRAATGKTTRREQAQAVGLAHLSRPPILADLRKQRKSKAPSGYFLHSEYGELLLRLKATLGVRAGPGERGNPAREKEARQQLRAQFPELGPRSRALREAASATPAEAAHIILGHRYDLSPEQIRDLLLKARRLHRQMDAIARSLRVGSS